MHTAANAYCDAIRQIPEGETRSFLELAALAGRPGSARAAGRALSECPTSLPWHRVVSADGLPRDDGRRTVATRRLVREGARPRADESIRAWAERAQRRLVGNYKSREIATLGHSAIETWPRASLELFASEAEARARNFRPVGEQPDTDPPLPARRVLPATTRAPSIKARLEAIDWTEAAAKLSNEGIFTLPEFLSGRECARLLNVSSEENLFDRHINMAPKGYGVGSYHYYKEPLPKPAHTLRRGLYRRLAPIAQKLWPSESFPKSLATFWKRCREHGQTRCSSILIGYGQGGINHPHRDIYGKVWFPFQVLILLSRRGRDFSGGDFYVMDEGPDAEKQQVAVNQGDLVLFASRERIQNGPGTQSKRIPMRHGMTLVTEGRRYGMGVVFHLAE